jgi:hypothetical protein
MHRSLSLVSPISLNFLYEFYWSASNKNLRLCQCSRSPLPSHIISEFALKYKIPISPWPAGANPLQRYFSKKSDNVWWFSQSLRHTWCKIRSRMQITSPIELSDWTKHVSVRILLMSIKTLVTRYTATDRCKGIWECVRMTIVAI